MRYMLRVGTLAIIQLLVPGGEAWAQSRTAIVIGNSQYQSTAPLKTPETDSAIVAETLRAAGYAVTELRDIRQSEIGQALRGFLDAVEAGGPDGAAIVYYSGYAAQSGGENYLVPVDATIRSDADVSTEAFRLADLLDELAKTPLAARIVILDASRDHRFGAGTGTPVARGLAMGGRATGTLLAFAAAPDTVSIDGSGTYSLYTGALVTQMRQPGLTLEQIFKGTRLQVNQATRGAQTPWMVSDLGVEVKLFAPPETPTPPPETPAAAPLPATPETVAPTPGATPAETTTPASRTARRPVPSAEDRVMSRGLLQSLSPDEAYAAVIDADTLEAYQWFVELYPDYRLSPRVWDIIAARREAILWQRTLAQNTARAYWNYLKRYPDGRHASEARDYLASLSAPPAPPASYVATPEPLPPDYSDEAVGVAEIVPEGVAAPADVFEVLAPIFVPIVPQVYVDPVPVDVIPDPIPVVVGNPVSVFVDRTVNINSSVTINKTTNVNNTTTINNNKTINNTKVINNKTINNLTTNKTGFVKGTPTKTPTKTPIAKGPTATAAGVDKTKKTGIALPPGKTPATKQPVQGPAKGLPAKPTPAKSGLTIPGKSTRVPGVTPAGPRPGTLLPTKPVPSHPGLPPVPGTAVKPGTPTLKTPTVGTHPGLPPTPVRPTPLVGTPATGPAPSTPGVTTPVHKGPATTIRPTPPTRGPSTPTVRSTPAGPKPAVPKAINPKPTVGVPSHPKPVTRTPTPPKPVVQKAPPPHPVVRTPQVRKPAAQVPQVRKPVAQPKPVAQKPPPRPTAVAKPPRPTTVAPPRPPTRVAPPPRPVAPKPAARTPNCRMINGKKVCT